MDTTNFFVGQSVYFIDNYNWALGKIVSAGPKNLKIECVNGNTYTKPRDRCAHSQESVAFVFETWKGRNGRGAYRVERLLYPQLRKPANQIARQFDHVNEKSYGVLL